MVEYCVWSKSLGPRCYEITKEEKARLDLSNTLTIIAIMIVIIYVLLNYKNKTKAPLITAMFIVFITIVIWDTIQKHRIINKSKLICSGAWECSGGRTHGRIL